MKPVVLIASSEITTNMLDVGRRWLALFGGGRLKVLVIRRPPLSFIIVQDEVLTPECEAVFCELEEKRANAMREIIVHWHQQHTDIALDLIELEADMANAACQHGERADLVIASRSTLNEPDMYRLLYDIDTPLLVLPQDYQGTIGQTIAIAWKDDGCAVKAIQDCLPIIDTADVHVLCVDAPATMPAILRDHSLRGAHLHSVASGDLSTGERLLEEAHRVDADLVVMGAFPHTRWFVSLFGSVTQTMLAVTDLPLLLRH